MNRRLRLVLDADVVAERFDSHEPVAGRRREGGTGVDAVRGPAARTEDDRCQVGDDPVDQTRVEQGAVHRRSAFDEGLEHAAPGESGEHLLEVDATVTLADRFDHGARRHPRVARRGRRAVGREDERRCQRGVEQRTGGGHPAPSVEEHPKRRCTERWRNAAHGQRRLVGERSARSDDDGLRVGAAFVPVGWTGLLAPAGTPQPIVRKLNREVVRVLPLPDVKDKLAGDGSEFGKNTPEEFSAFIKQEIAKWAKVVKASGAKAD